MAEAGVHLLMFPELVALEGLAVAVASVTNATGEPCTMVRELLAQRSLCYWRSLLAIRGLRLLDVQSIWGS